MGAMERQERQQVRATAEEVAQWVDRARSILSHRANVTASGDQAVTALRRGFVPVLREGAVAWRVLPLRPADGHHLTNIALQARLPAISPDEQRALDGLTTDAATALRDLKAVVGAQRFFAGKRKREAGTNAADLISRYQEWGLSADLPRLLDRLAPSDNGIRPHPARRRPHGVGGATPPDRGPRQHPAGARRHRRGGARRGRAQHRRRTVA